MRFITADYIFPVTQPPVRNGILVVDENGIIQDVLNENFSINESIEKHNGILIPGFVNAHCHLELSHLKNKLNEGGGLTNFISQIIPIRNKFSQEEIADAIEKADAEMFNNGIVAVGDISNTSDSFSQKAKSKIFYHTFIEVFDLNGENASMHFENGLKLVDELRNNYGGNSNFSYSITPHAPYSVSDKLFQLIDACAYENDSLLSIHNQETESENELFSNRSGKLFDSMSKMGVDYSWIKANGYGSLQNTLVKMQRCAKTLLVHNTYTSKADIEWAQSYSKMIYWCFCPNANLFIENRLPQFENFIAANSLCLLGTDSYASNWSLSILDEMKSILKMYPLIPFETLLNWATINGAMFFNQHKTLGSFEKGKQPGINLIENFNFETMQLNSNSLVKKIA